MKCISIFQRFYPIEPSPLFSLLPPQFYLQFNYSLFCLKSHPLAPYSLEQRLANYSLQAKFCLPAFLNAVLLVHSHVICTSFLRLLWHYSDKVGQFQQKSHGSKSLQYTLSMPFQKHFNNHSPTGYFKTTQHNAEISSWSDHKLNFQHLVSPIPSLYSH